METTVSINEVVNSSHLKTLAGKESSVAGSLSEV